MAYIQFALLHIPAHVIVGDSLSQETREHWFTPAHILGGWNARLASQRQASAQPVLAIPGNALARPTSEAIAPKAPAHPVGEQLTLF